MATFESRENKVLSFMEQVQEEILMKEQEEAFLNTPDFKLKKLDQCQNDGKAICLDSIIRSLYKDAIPLNDDYKCAHSDSLDNTFDT